MELREPKRKHRVRVSVQQPFPILNRDTISANNDLWQVYTGKYSGDFVVVDAPDEMLALHNMGFFGKGALSRAGPEFGKERQGIPPFIRHRQWKQRCEWAEQQKTMMMNYSKKQAALQKVNSRQETCVGNEDAKKETGCLENQASSVSCSSINDKHDILVEKMDVTTNLGEKPECIVENIKNSGISTTKNNHDAMNKDDEIITIDSRKETGCLENQPNSGSCSSINDKHDISVEQKDKMDVTTNSGEKPECIVKNMKDSGINTKKKYHDTMNTDDDIITIDSTDEDNVNSMDKNPEKSDDSNANKNNEKNLSESNEVIDGKENKNKGNKRKRNSDLECDGSKVNNTKDLSDNCITNDKCMKPADGMQERMLVVLPDSDSDDEGYLTNICPRLEKEIFPICEALHLTLEEAFFLSYGLGCLQVIDLFGNYLALDGMWQLFCKSQKDFIPKYVVYHYFRSKGWVVKPGIKFGGDLLLYKQGPPFYHASYIVVIEVVDKSSWTRIPGFGRTLSWTRLMGLNRLGESAGKEILLCQVIWPSDESPESLEFPSVLNKFQVHEVLIRRWISSQEREENEIL